VAPAVVTIRAVSFQEAPEGHGHTADDDAGGAVLTAAAAAPTGAKRPERSLLRLLLRPASPRPAQPGAPAAAPQEFRSEAGGSGFVISGDGLIATNYHVIEGASELMVTVGDDPRELPPRCAASIRPPTWR
jgi:S1-C subfamily serine protease